VSLSFWPFHHLAGIFARWLGGWPGAPADLLSLKPLRLGVDVFRPALPPPFLTAGEALAASEGIPVRLAAASAAAFLPSSFSMSAL